MNNDGIGQWKKNIYIFIIFDTNFTYSILFPLQHMYSVIHNILYIREEDHIRLYYAIYLLNIW